MASQAQATMNSNPAWCALACLPRLDTVDPPLLLFVAVRTGNVFEMCSECLWQSRDSTFQMPYPAVQSDALALSFPWHSFLLRLRCSMGVPRAPTRTIETNIQIAEMTNIPSFSQICGLEKIRSPTAPGALWCLGATRLMT